MSAQSDNLDPEKKDAAFGRDAIPVLVGEDDEGMCRLIQRVLEREGFRVTTATSGNGVLAQLESLQGEAVLLLDYDLTDMQADAVALEWQKRRRRPTFVIMTGKGDESLAVKLMKLGATDYLVKDSTLLNRLPRVLDAALERRSTQQRLEDAEELLRQNQARMDLALWAAEATPWEWQVHNDELRFGKLLSSLLGEDEHEQCLPFADWLARIHVDDRDRTAAAFARLKSGRRPLLEVDYRVAGTAGRWHWLMQRGKGVDYADGGQLLRAAGTIVETTAQRELEGQLRDAQKMEAIGRLAGGIAHDFNNLMTIVIGNCQLGLQRPDEPAKMCERFERIMKAAKRAGDLTRQLLAFSRRQVLLPRQVAVNDVIGNFIEMVDRTIGEDIELQAKLGTEKMTVYADPGQLEQVLLNLAINSREAMPGGGKLVVRTFSLNRAEYYLRYTEKTDAANMVCIQVEDNGKGIDAEQLKNIFEPFYTTKEPGSGTGLGLATVYGIIKQSGGHVAVRSAPGQGTCFDICLPMINGDGTDEKADTGELPGLGAGTEHVLVVEDELLVRQMARESLESLGYRVLEAENGAEALRVYLEHRDEIDIVVSDMIMPVMSGQELATRLRAIAPSLPLIFMSGYPLQHDKILNQLGDYTVYLQKPFSPIRLCNLVRSTLDAIPSSSD